MTEFNHDNKFGVCLYHSGIEKALEAIYSKIDEREKMVNMRFVESEKAILEARKEMDRRLEGMNEFRSQLERQANTFIARAEWESKHEIVNTKIYENYKAIEGLRRDMAQRVGAKQWTDYIITIGVSSLIYFLFHYLLKS